MTAYFGFLDICDPRPGDTVVVSAASGAVGQVVGQIAKIMGCRVIGFAGSDAKVDFITNELGFDIGINYKTADIPAALAAACPLGVNIYFDNVGGPVTDAVMENLADFARISVCGQISQYNTETPVLGPRNMRMLTTHQARMEGFLVFQFAARHDEAAPPHGSLDPRGQTQIPRRHRQRHPKRPPRLHRHDARRKLRQTHSQNRRRITPCHNPRYPSENDGCSPRSAA